MELGKGYTEAPYKPYAEEKYLVENEPRLEAAEDAQARKKSRRGLARGTAELRKAER